MQNENTAELWKENKNKSKIPEQVNQAYCIYICSPCSLDSILNSKVYIYKKILKVSFQSGPHHPHHHHHPLSVGVSSSPLEHSDVMQTLHQYFGSNGGGDMPLPPPPPPPHESEAGGSGWLDHSGVHPGLFAHQEYDYGGLARYNSLEEFLFK